MPAPRTATIARRTAETDITLTLTLDGSGIADIDTGIGFFDHMLTLFAKHSLIDLKVRAKGDLHVDYHHTVEDAGIVLGQAVRQALGAGLQRLLGFQVAHAIGALGHDGAGDAEVKRAVARGAYNGRVGVLAHFVSLHLVVKGNSGGHPL